MRKNSDPGISRETPETLAIKEPQGFTPKAKIVVEMRRVELLSESISIRLSPSAVNG